MRNHDQKTKDMIESVLPSAARKRARAERRLIHHSRRGREAQALHRYLRAGDYDYAPDSGKAKSDLDEMVFSRRAADKVGPLTRWAVRRVTADPDLRDTPVHEQLNYFRTLLPDNLIGEHALTHIEWALQWESRHAEYGRSARRRRADEASREVISTLTEQLNRIVATGQHGRLNRRIKATLAQEATVQPPARNTAATPRRLLRGAHDVDAFARDVYRSDAIRTIVSEFCP